VSTALRPRLGRLGAHELVGAACRTAVRERRDLIDVLLETPEAREPLGEQRLRELLDPAGYLGSTGELVRRALQHHAEHHEGAG
jgi:3-carboxy-cis,cis-muconate cycloisomerase